MGRAAILFLCILCLGSRLRNDGNSGFWVLMYTSLAASCARHFLWDTYEYQQLWYFSSVLCAMIKVLNLSVFHGDQTSTDELIRLVSIVESIARSIVLIANSRRQKGWRRLFSRFPERVEIAGDFLKYDRHTREAFVTDICSARGRRLSIRASSLRLDMACSFDEVEEVPAIPSWNTFVWHSTRQSWIVTKDYTDNIGRPLA